MKIHKKLANGAYQTIDYKTYKPLLKATVKKVITIATPELPIPIYIHKSHIFSNQEKGVLICFGKPDTKLKPEIKKRAKTEKKETIVGSSYLAKNLAGDLTLYIIKSGGNALPSKIYKEGKILFKFLKIDAIEIVEQKQYTASKNTDIAPKTTNNKKALAAQIKTIAQSAKSLKKGIQIFAKTKANAQELKHDIHNFLGLCQDITTLPLPILKFKQIALQLLDKITETPPVIPSQLRIVTRDMTVDRVFISAGSIVSISEEAGSTIIKTEGHNFLLASPENINQLRTLNEDDIVPISDIDKLPLSERKKIVLTKSVHRERFSNIGDHIQNPIEDEDVKHIVTFPDIPEQLHTRLNNIIHVILKRPDDVKAYSMGTFSVDFDTAQILQDDYQLSIKDANTYGNKKWAFSFTVFPIEVALGNNTDDLNYNNTTLQTYYVVVEDFGEISKMDQPLSAEETTRLQEVLDENNIKHSIKGDNKEVLLSALNKLPIEVFKRIGGFEIEIADIEHRGLYNPKTKKIQFGKNTLNNENTFIGDDDNDSQYREFVNSAQFSVLHEVGHAYDYYKFNLVYHKYLDWAKDKTQDMPEEIKPYVKKQCYTTSGGRSLQIIDKTIAFSDEENHDTAFYTALKADNPNRLTKYSETNLREAFAEAFALYFSAPNLVKKLSPNIHNYFKNIEKI